MKNNEKLDDYFYDIYDSPIGRLFLKASYSAVIKISFFDFKEDYSIKTNEILIKLKNELELYFFGKLEEFSIKIDLRGTKFQKECWNELLRIPYGETISYQEEAIQIGDKNKARACGMANHYNPIAIVVPCHRVIGKNGKLTGYAPGLEHKRYLLNLERTTRGAK